MPELPFVAAYLLRQLIHQIICNTERYAFSTYFLSTLSVHSLNNAGVIIY